jgi:predicted O-methyltransferase YrrM
MKYLHSLIAGARTKYNNVRGSSFRTGGPIPADFIRMEPWEIEYLYIVASTARVGIVETGRFNGGSVITLASANPNVPITSIDIAPQNDAALMAMMMELGVGGNVTLITGDSQKTKYDVPYDVVYIDGDHSFQGCLNDLHNWCDDLMPGGHVILHDCYYGNEVQQAVVEYLRGKNVIMHLTPFIPRHHKNVPTGSLCHFQKPF